MGELGPSEPGDEVPAPDGARFLHQLEDGIHRGEPAGGSLGERGLARDDAVPVEELGSERMGALRRARDPADHVGDERPATGARGRAGSP